MKKFLAILVCCLALITCTLSGCATFSINKVKYYNEVLATVGSTKITRYELLTAYNSYGSSYYVSQMGKSEKEALEETLNLLIERESLYQYALEHDIYAPTAYQVNEDVQAIFDSVDDLMKDYTKSAKLILNIEIKEEETETEDEKDSYVYTDYSDKENCRAVLKTRTVKKYYTDATKTTQTNSVTEFYDEIQEEYIVYNDVETPTSYTALIDNSYLNNYKKDGTVQAIVDSYLVHYKKSLVNETRKDDIYTKAISLMVHDIINSEYYLRDANNKPFNTVTDDVLYRYFEKSFNSQIKSTYLENIRTEYLKTEELSISELIEQYQYLVNYSYSKYEGFESSYNSDMKDIGDDGDTILYHLSTDAEFGYYGHTLLSFDDNAKNAIKALDSAKEAGMDSTTYNTKYVEILKNVKLSVRNLETGEIEIEATDDNAPSIIDALKEYKDNVVNASNSNRLAKFTEFMYKYTGDTATLSGGMPYVVGKNGNSAMETAFTEEAIRLYDEAKELGITSGNISTETENVNNMCVTSYGIHLLYFFGDVKAFDIPYVNRNEVKITLNPSANYNLYTTELNPITHKTYFDMLFDKVYPASSDDEIYSSNTGYDNEEDRLIALSQKTHKVTKYTSKIKATKTSL